MDRLERLLQIEVGIVLLGLFIGTWLVYRLFLRDATPERKRNLESQFTNLSSHILFGTMLFMTYFAISKIEEPASALSRLNSYFGLATLVQGAIALVKIFRIFIFEYLFISHKRVAVPLLLVNIFTLLLTIVLSAWLLSEVFGVRLAPLVATSAAFSLILGLALQDTLGNLFAGITLQLDKPYEIGDWIEVHADGQKWIGQIEEISWRATVLTGIGDESVTIPNKLMAQAKISNYSSRIRPIARSHTFRLRHDCDIQTAKTALLEATQEVEGIHSGTPPVVLVSEATENFLILRLIYYVDDFGKQWKLADQVIKQAIAALKKRGIPLATPRLSITRETRESA